MDKPNRIVIEPLPIQRTAVGVMGRAVEVRFEVTGSLPVEPLAVTEEIAE